jgi:hypothetical protein
MPSSGMLRRENLKSYNTKLEECSLLGCYVVKTPNLTSSSKNALFLDVMA